MPAAMMVLVDDLSCSFPSPEGGGKSLLAEWPNEVSPSVTLDGAEMLPNVIFQLCGLQSYAAHGSPFGSSLALLWCVGNILLYAAVLTFCFLERRWLFADRRKRGLNFIPFIKASITIVAHLVVLGEALLARNAYRAFDERVGRVDGQLERLTPSARDVLRRAGRRFRNKLLLFVTLCCAVELAILAMAYPDAVQETLWCATVPSLLIIRLKHLHHAHHIDRLAARFGILREQLEQLLRDEVGAGANECPERDRKSSAQDRWKGMKEVMNRTLTKNPPTVGHLNGTGVLYRTGPLRRMFLINGTYLTLWHAAKDLNGCCVYSQLANLLQNFIQCTCDLYSMYALLYLNQFEDIFGFILSVVATFAALGIVLAACENCRNQVGQMGQLLHKRHGDEGDWLAKMVENFSLLLQHTPLYFSLGGFFDMDFVLLKEMAAAITTYMVIFIQFMPKDDSGTLESVAVNASVAPASTATPT